MEQPALSSRLFHRRIDLVISMALVAGKGTICRQETLIGDAGFLKAFSLIAKVPVTFYTGFVIGRQKVLTVPFIIYISGFFVGLQLVMAFGYGTVLNRAFAIPLMVAGLTGIVKVISMGKLNRRPFCVSAFRGREDQCAKGYLKGIR